MRYQDWDVLLFPQGSHVPLREFRTACFSQQDPRTMTTTPLLSAFVPALSAGAPFQVSVHSWSQPGSMILGAEGNGNVGGGGYVPGTVYQWRVKIVVDGGVVAGEKFAEEASWPRQMDSSSATDTEGKKLPLSFPRFHRSILAQSHWNAKRTFVPFLP
ncbi:hypothetical protein B0A55_03717 [Friedmanniomyces simplex]|uniref:Uncharacterized protein n=1 Tax=Friedmanniomyces simplex TaxID=329884 RepID=A0A4U0XRB0_9PEZI|nr:hypothetical protein B0A55_03717 [Friedmanniomyces simplex]